VSFGRAIFDAFAKHGGRVAIVTAREEITYAQALTQVGHIAANFRASGVRAGTYVGLAMQNTVDVLLGILACWRLSATAVVIDFRAPRSQRASLVRDFDLAMIFEDLRAPGAESYPDPVFGPDWRRVSPRCEDLPAGGDDRSPAFLLFSSGTTGTPKAYVQTHEGLSARISNRKGLLDSSEMRFLTPMPLTYSATRHQVFGYLLQGGTVRLFPPFFSPQELIEAILAFRASGTALPPAVIARLVKEAGARSEALFPGLTVLASIGGPARPEDKVAAYHHLSPGYRIGYASSLTGMIAMLSGQDVLDRPETTGRIVQSARVEILGGDGKALPVGEAGLIKAWTPSVTPAVITPGGAPYVDPETMGPGWGIPGDIGYLAGDGFLTIVDRQADMIVRGGVNVAPQELERIIARHPKAGEVAVVGFPDDIMGQEIAAFIVSDTGTVDEFLAFMRANIAPDRRPREIRLARSLPYNEHGKLQRRLLVEEILRDRLERKPVK
jgi:acyl-CoA synthetase (AMP-forming)/AMP-acid ligase II